MERRLCDSGESTVNPHTRQPLAMDPVGDIGEDLFVPDIVEQVMVVALIWPARLIGRPSRVIKQLTAARPRHFPQPVVSPCHLRRSQISPASTLEPKSK